MTDTPKTITMYICPDCGRSWTYQPFNHMHRTESRLCRTKAEVFVYDLRVGASRMNYRDLLVKYMAHVGHEEGVNFVIQLPSSCVKFTAEERDELVAVSGEALKL